MKGSVWTTAWTGAVGLALLAAACAERDKRMEPTTDLALRTLNGEEIRRVLVGNTLVGYDTVGPFWMYYPTTAALWGKSSSGDVDIGGWRIDGNYYCRAWRRWLDSRERCWLFATDGSNRLLWITPNGAPDGASMVQHGNTIGQIAEARTLLALVDADLAAAPAPPSDDAVIDGFGNRLTARTETGSEPGRGGIDGGTGSDGTGGGSGGTSSGGTSSGGTSSDGTSSGGTSSGGTSSDGTSSGGTSGDDGDDGGKGKGKGRDKDRDAGD